ncbi:MAG: DUF4438 domain-containing protein [bacterium]|nr:DUF4438 domain-containing protein [bacterium]
MIKKTTTPKEGILLGGLRTNADKLVAMAAVGEIAPPKLGPLPYRIQAKTGQAIPLPGTGSITFNKRIGDNCIDLVGDHIEPGATIEYRGSSDGGFSPNNGLNTLACIGNPVRVLTGEAKGETGRVTGTHGGVEHVIVDFPPDVLADLAIGDKMQVHAFGIGLELLDFPDIKLFNLDPQLLHVLDWKKDRSGKLVVPVTHFVPGKVMGSGLGNNHVWRGDYDIQMFDEKMVAEYNLKSLRFGDIVALMDVDNSYGRIWSEGSVTIGVIIHSNSVVAGHGPGVTTIATSLSGNIKPVISEQANLAYLFEKMKSKRKK